MGGVTIFPPRPNNVPVTSSVYKDPEPTSEPVIAPVISEPIPTRRAEARPIEPAGKTILAGAPRETATPREASTAQRSPAIPERSARTFRVAGVALDDVLNVRDGPSADYRATGAILPDAIGVRIVGQCRAEWCPIIHRGVTGWVNSFYLIEDTTVRGSERQRRPATEYRR